MIIIMTIMQNTQIIITENHDYYLWVGDVCSFLDLGCPFPSGWLSVRARLGTGWQEQGLSPNLSSCPGSQVWDFSAVPGLGRRTFLVLILEPP